MNIQEYFTTDSDSPKGNVVEIYVCPYEVKDSALTVVTAWPNPIRPINLGGGNKRTFQEYWQTNMCYSYDMSNDAQMVVARSLMEEHFDGSLYSIVLKEDVLPSHRFPCTTDIHAKIAPMERASYRINNRLHLIVENDKNVFIRYDHADNVDIIKMQADLDSIINTLHLQMDS